METQIAQRIRERLKALGKSAAATSLEAGLGRSALQDILSGRVGNPRFDTLTKIADALDCSVGFLTGVNQEPSEGLKWSELNEYSLFDAVPEHIRDRLAAGVFRTDEADDHTPERGDLHIAYRDIRHPDLGVSLYEQADSTMAGIGILKGDIVTATDLGSDEIALIPGRLVIVRRVIGMEGPVEMSLRVIEKVQGEITLAVKPPTGSPKPIVIASRRVQDGEERSNPNFYWTNPDNEGWVHIEALVIRVTRNYNFLD